MGCDTGPGGDPCAHAFRLASTLRRTGVLRVCGPSSTTKIVEGCAPGYEQLLIDLQLALGPDRKPLLIGIDGREGVGKTSLSSWFAWQLGMPVIHLDLFLKQSEVPAPVTRRTADLDRCIKARGKRPFIVEGVFLLDAMEELERSVDPDLMKAYLSRRAPTDLANFKLRAY